MQTPNFSRRGQQQERRSQIHHLEINGATLITHSDKTAALTDYYTTILGRVTVRSWGFDLQVLYSHADQAEEAPLIAPFSEGEAKQAIRNMNSASAPGPDGLGPSFYAATWDTTKRAVMEFLQAFYCGAMDL